jgi:(2Fe-2S) ferredoxin
MEKNAVPYKKTVFVCVNERPPDGPPCCCGRGSVGLHAELKARVKALGLGRVIRVSKSGCLNQCAQGPNIMVFPDNVWYSGVTEGDLDTILGDIAGGVTAE